MMLKYVAVCCIVLQCAAVSTLLLLLQMPMMLRFGQERCSALQCVVVRLLQCVAVCCSLSTVAAASIANDAHVDCMYMETKKQCNALLTDLAGMLRSLGVFCGKVWERVLVGQILPSYPL